MVTRARLNAARRRRRILWLSVVAGAVTVAIVVAAVLVLETRVGNEALIGQPVSAAIMSQLTGVADSTLSSVGTGQGVTAPTAISGAPLASDGKPEVFYFGGDFCPYCGVERWSMVITLSRFGTFTNLQYMLSSSTDIFPNTATFTFRNTQYSSPYISFVAVEQYGRAGVNDIKQQLTADQQEIVSTYNSRNSIPFIDIANQYSVVGAQASPSVLSGKNWTQIASQLNDPNSDVAKAVDGAANYLIGAICKADGGKPSNVCAASYASIPVSFQASPASGLFQVSQAPLLRSLPRKWTI